jgi:hypothetical protein
MRTPPSCSRGAGGPLLAAGCCCRKRENPLVPRALHTPHHQITHSHSQSVMLVMRWGSSTRSRSSRRSSSLDLRDSLIAPPARSDKCPSWNCLKCASGAGPDRASERAYLPLWELSSGTPREKRRLGYDVIRPAANQKTARYTNCSATYNHFRSPF